MTKISLYIIQLVTLTAIISVFIKHFEKKKTSFLPPVVPPSCLSSPPLVSLGWELLLWKFCRGICVYVTVYSLADITPKRVYWFTKLCSFSCLGFLWGLYHRAVLNVRRKPLLPRPLSWWKHLCGTRWMFHHAIKTRHSPARTLSEGTVSIGRYHHFNALSHVGGLSLLASKLREALF